MDLALRTLQPFLRFITALLIVAMLYFGRDVLMPLALAALFSFLLSPAVKLLKRWRLPQVLAVIVVTLCTFVVVSFIGWFVFNEMNNLANDLPKYRENIKQKIENLKNASKGGTLEKINELVGEVSESVENSATDKTEKGTQEAPKPDSQQGFIQKTLQGVLPSLAAGIGMSGVVIVFVIFFLLRQDEISERIVRLVGFSHLTDTTRAIDEANERISRYLLMQMTVNSLYGVLLVIGLWFIGLPYVVLWGVLGCLFRFIPYVGPIIIAILPSSLALAVFDNWTHPLMVVGLILGLELLTNMILEPLLYGHSVGVSDVALLIAITFWTWIWGAIGLVLATPLTVCIVVLCKYIPSLKWVDTLMGDKVEVDPHLIFYQQLLADRDEDAQNYVVEMVDEKGLGYTMDHVLIPALALTRREFVYGKLEVEEASEIFEKIDGFQELLIQQDEAATDKALENEKENTIEKIHKDPAQHTTIVAKALNGEPDIQALKMLESLLSDPYDMRISNTAKLAGELLSELENEKPSLLVISAMPPRSQLAASVLCKRVRRSRPETKILICRWGLPEIHTFAKLLSEAGADWIATSVEEAKKIIETEVI